MKNMFKQYSYFYTDEQYKDIWENGLFVFDTNTLLNLYRYQEETKDEFLQVLDKISSRIWIPHHVALEFQRNRLNVICEQKELFSKTKKAIELTSKTLNAELEKLSLNKRHSLIKVDDFTEDFKKLSDNFLNKLNDLKLKQQHLSKLDSIKERLDNLFYNKVGQAPKNQQELDALYKDAESRYKNKTPPGYLDSEKIDLCIDSMLIYKKKFGDFLVWKQILEYCCEHKKNKLIFITNDLKEDWWFKYNASGERFNQPRPELIDEALHVAGINEFIMYDSEKFLNYAPNYLEVKVSDSSVKEVRDTIEMYNKDIEKSNFLKMKENKSASLERLKKSLALKEVVEFKRNINFEIYRNGGMVESHTEVFVCPECELETMIPNNLSRTGYKCTYCQNEESDEIEVLCSICGVDWPNSEMEHIEWTEEGDIENVCPYCRHDPEYVGDD